MGQEARSFQPEFYPDKEIKPQKGADIIPFPQKEKESRMEIIGRSYTGYKALGGILSPEEYQQDVLKRISDKTRSGSEQSEYVNSIARTAKVEITAITPEIVAIYGILSDERPGLRQGPDEMGDQSLLIAAFRNIGDESSALRLEKRIETLLNEKR